MASIQLGPLSTNAESFQAVCMLLATHPIYASVPLRRTMDLLHALQLERIFGAVADGKLLGIMSWTTVSEDAAKDAIAKREMPPKSKIDENGGAVIATTFLAENHDVSRLLWNGFLNVHKGRILLYERHRLGNKAPAVFKWVDKSGRMMGANL